PSLPISHASADAGTLRERIEEPPRSLEGPTPSADAVQRPEPDREPGAGAGPPRSGGLFADRVSAGPKRAAFARSGNGLYPPSYPRRIKAPRQQPLLNFDAAPSHDPVPPTSIPPEALIDGTVISPPAIASRNGDPTPLPACNDAALPAE